ncbi:MAG: DUF29 domain-containing protein [Deltaproteobacteria bacterium]|nr:DUF29 domain-containing protein [Deltaproteobacteria bacterium]
MPFATATEGGTSVIGLAQLASKPAIEEQLYETDFARWLEQQAQALKERRCAALDWNNLAEEIEGLVRSDRRALKSFLRNALVHMLELAYWQSEREHNERQWRQHLLNARAEIAAILEDSPSLERHLANVFESAYRAARCEAETLIGEELPEQCPWALQQVQSDTFYPLVAPPLRQGRRQ